MAKAKRSPRRTREQLLAELPPHSKFVRERRMEQPFLKINWSARLSRATRARSTDEFFPFFDGLIPEGWLLNLASKNWKLKAGDRMSLLLTLCQDCIGATHVIGTNASEVKESSIKTSFAQPSTTAKAKSDKCLVCMQALTGDESLYHRKSIVVSL